MVKFNKETVFEGFYAACWETSYLSKKPEYKGKGHILDHKRRWLREYLNDLISMEKEDNQIDRFLHFDDLIPHEVFHILLKEGLNTKFRSAINVEVEQI